MRTTIIKVLIITISITFTLLVYGDPIHDAAREGNVKKVRMLIDEGIDINKKDAFG